MKQAIDTFTVDMYSDTTTEVRESLTTDRFKYSFHIRTLDGAVTEWTGLTKKRARDMHAYTEQSQPSNVASFGWELTR